MNLDALRAFALELPAGMPVTLARETVLELLGQPGGSILPPADLTVRQLAERWDRQVATIRADCREGRIAGAYLFRRRDWRIPLSSVRAYEAEARTDRTETGGGDSAPLDAYKAHLNGQRNGSAR